MPKIILNALLRSKNPEEFVEEVLLPSILVQRSRVPKKLAGQIPESIFLGGNTQNLIFYSKKRRHTIQLRFENLKIPIIKLGPNYRDGNAFRERFHASIGKNTFFELDPKQFQSALASSGYFRHMHSGQNPSISDYLAFNHSLLAKKRGWRGKIIYRRKNPKDLMVELDTRQFDALSELDSQVTFIQRYMNTISHLTSSSEKKYRGHQKYSPFEIPKGSNYTPYQMFHHLYSAKYGRFMQLIPTVREENIVKFVQKHLGLPKKIATHYAKGLSKMLYGGSGSKLRDAARQIAQDALKGDISEISTQKLPKQIMEKQKPQTAAA